MPSAQLPLNQTAPHLTTRDTASSRLKVTRALSALALLAGLGLSITHALAGATPMEILKAGGATSEPAPSTAARAPRPATAQDVAAQQESAVTQTTGGGLKLPPVTPAMKPVPPVAPAVTPDDNSMAAAPGPILEPIKTATAKMNQTVAHVTNGAGVIIGTFPGPYGFTGLVVEGQTGTPFAGHKVVMWAVKGGEAVILGPLVTTQGVNLTEQVMNKLGITTPGGGQKTSTRLQAWPAHSKQRAAIHQMMDATGFASFTEGSGPLKFTVFMDPNCIACHEFWENLNAVQDWQKKYTVTWVPVGFLKPDSPGKSAALLKGHGKALSVDELGFNTTTEEGGIAPLNDAKLLNEVEINKTKWTGLDSLIGLESATPTVVTGNGDVLAFAVPMATLDTLMMQKTTTPAKP